MRSRVLDVGNCDADHALIRDMLVRHFDVEVERVMFVDEAISAMKKTHYQLVLVNRLIFDDGSPGIELLRRAKADTTIADASVMMVSNYAQAQAASVAAGGVPGFGKSALNQPDTISTLSAYLPVK